MVTLKLLHKGSIACRENENINIKYIELTHSLIALMYPAVIFLAAMDGGHLVCPSSDFNGLCISSFFLVVYSLLKLIIYHLIGMNQF